MKGGDIMTESLQPILHKIFEALETLGTSTSNLEKEFAVMKQDIAELKADVAILKADVAELKADVAILKADVAELKADVAILKTDVRGLKEATCFLWKESDSQLDIIYQMIQQQKDHTTKLYQNTADIELLKVKDINVNTKLPKMPKILVEFEKELAKY